MRAIMMITAYCYIVFRAVNFRSTAPAHSFRLDMMRRVNDAGVRVIRPAEYRAVLAVVFGVLHDVVFRFRAFLWFF